MAKQPKKQPAKTKAELKKMFEGLSPNERIKLQQLLIEDGTILDSRVEDQIAMMNLLIIDSSVILELDGKILDADPDQKVKIDDLGTAFYPLTDDIGELDYLEDDDFDENEDNESEDPEDFFTSTKPGVVVHCHGLSDDQPKFVILLHASHFFTTTPRLLQVGETLDAIAGTKAVYADNSYEMTSPLTELPEGDELATLAENYQFKVVKINHRIGEQPFNSITEVFLAPLDEEIPLMLQLNDSSIAIVDLCSCQDLSSHDPLHIQNRNN